MTNGVFSMLILRKSNSDHFLSRFTRGLSNVRLFQALCMFARMDYMHGYRMHARMPTHVCKVVVGLVWNMRYQTQLQKKHMNAPRQGTMFVFVKFLDEIKAGWS